MTADPQKPAAGSRPGLSVAFCPTPPLLLPVVAGRAADETVALRSACADALDAVLATGPSVVVVVGDGPAGARYGPGAVGSLHGFGVDVELGFAGPSRPGGGQLPLPHTVGSWLLDEAMWDGARLGISPDDLAGVLGRLPGPVGVLAMGDGSARRTVKAPGYLDDAAGPFDAVVADALRTGNAAALAALDPVEGERLLAAGVPTWRAVGTAVAGRPVDAQLHYDDAPHGVGYLVADWTVQ